MADYVQIPPDSSGKLIDAPGVLNEVGTLVQRERVIVGDLAVAIYNLINTLKRPLYVEPSTGRLRISTEAIASTVTYPISTMGGATVNDSITFHLMRQRFASAILTRIA